MVISFDMYVPTRFVFGTGRLGELHQQKMSGKKAMLAISNGKSVYENGALERTQEQLKKAGISNRAIQWNRGESHQNSGYEWGKIRP